MSSSFRKNPLSGRLTSLSPSEINRHVSSVDASKVLLAGSTDGKPILVTEGTPGTDAVLIHKSQDSALDEVWIYAANIDTTNNYKLYLKFGINDPDIVMDIPDNTGLFLAVPGFMLTNGASIHAYASAANKINIFGWVNRFYSMKQRSTQGEGWTAGD